MPYLMGAFKERKMFVFFHQAKSLQLIKLNSNTFKSIEDNFQLRALATKCSGFKKSAPAFSLLYNELELPLLNCFPTGSNLP